MRIEAVIMQCSCCGKNLFSVVLVSEFLLCLICIQNFPVLLFKAEGKFFT